MKSQIKTMEWPSSIRSICFLPALLFLALSCNKEDNPTPSSETELSERETELVGLLQNEATPIGTSPLQIPDSDLAVFDRLADTRIVGLGEATHGTREFFQMKHRIFQYLVENHGYDAFVFEMDLAEAMIFDRWIQGEDNSDLTTLMRERMYFWTWRTEEVAQLFRWMKRYNEKQVENSKIHLLGVDTQTPGYGLDELENLVAEAEPVLADSIRNLNPTYRTLLNFYPNQAQAEADKVNAGIAATQELLKREKERLIAGSSAYNYQWMQRLARHMEQVASYQYQLHFQKDYRLRDQYMAENTDWFFDLLGEETQLALWAHNGHVAKDPTYGNAPSQGGHLFQTHQSDYQVVGFGFSTGRFTAVGGPLQTYSIPEIPASERPSFNFIFSNATDEGFILDLRAVQDPTLREWLQNHKRFLQLGALYQTPVNQYYDLIPLTQYFDFLVYFDKTLNSVLL